MDRRLHYEALPTSDDGESIAPPEYSTEPAATSATSSDGAVSNIVDETAYQPPPYSSDLDLPTYDESMRAKLIEDAARHATDESETLTHQETPAQTARQTRQKLEAVIGTDAMFILGFILSFLFNWIGLLAAFCLMHTCAGRFGALTGFGLSLVKWVTIAKRNNWVSGVSDENVWIWWLLLLFGVLISCSGALQYLRLKFVLSRAQRTDNSISRLF